MGYRLECLCMVLLAQLHRTVSVEFKVLGPVGDIVAVAGEDVILPCYLKPSINAVDSRVKWNHLNTVIHHYQDRIDRSERQNPSYKERTALFKDELKQGNTSLKLMGVKISDEGIYICIVQYKGSFDDVFMKVIVTAKGWYPEPELVWQDSKGQTLSTGPPEIHRDPKDPEGPYTVISRIVVPEGDNIFTCGVHMKLINHTKKAEIHTTGA
ncbi:unnamed protein product [Coregonus sp. 'balchen']|nr:unnamed protein product [Coregonus sp. 'balchen']